jgi:multicomponent Na+:H+ antiporter subunit G
MALTIAVATLVAAAALLALVCAVGVLALPDPYQKLHFIAPPATLSAAAIALALFLGEPDRQAGAKATLVAVLLTVMNAVVTHATARAARIREKARLGVRVEEEIPVVGDWRYAGEVSSSTPAPSLRRGRPRPPGRPAEAA